MIKNDKGTVYSDEGKYLHKIGSDVYVKKIYMLPSDTLNMYEEVDELPKQTDEEYKQKIQSLIRERYSLEDEIALLANINSPMELSDEKVQEYQNEYLEYQMYRNECKLKAKDV